jgi:CheY-like chemotaxis protein
MGRVLIVDDHEDTRTVLARIVNDFGHEAMTLREGAEAIVSATENRPGLMILDLMLSGVTGFDVLRALRADPRTREMPIVIYTALHDPEFVEQALSLGANDYWLKGSFNLETIEQWLRYYITEGKQ